MNSYQQEQLDALLIVYRHLQTLPPKEIVRLKTEVADYLSFRSETETFLQQYFSQTCTETCYRDQLSACCSKDGIITFFADTVINVLMSEPEDIRGLMAALEQPNRGFKCVYLSNRGCLWRIKPIVCEMFVCDAAQHQVFETYPEAKAQWKAIRKREKHFTWPSQPVLFDAIEQYFIDAGYTSSLMYLHNSPGLLRVKQKGLKPAG